MPPAITIKISIDRGIGRATALCLVSKGRKIGVGYRARKVVEKISYFGGEAIAIQTDISQEEQIVALFKQIDKDLGPFPGW